jgi:hypothetical protein
MVALAAALFFARGPAQQAADAASLTLFPERVALNVTPGHAKIKAGTPLAIQAKLVGNRAPIIAQVQIADGERWRAAEMTSEKDGSFRLALPTVNTSFKYRVVAGAATSPTYDVSVAFPPARRASTWTTRTRPGCARAADRGGQRRYLRAAGTEVRVRVHRSARGGRAS